MKTHSKPAAPRNEAVRSKKTEKAAGIPRVVGYDPNSKEPGHAINDMDPQCKK